MEPAQAHRPAACKAPAANLLIVGTCTSSDGSKSRIHSCHLTADLQLKDVAHAAAQVRCLNEATENSAQGVFRAWNERLDPPDVPLESNEDDPELLLHIPFEGAAKVKALCIIGARLRCHLSS